MQLEHQVCSLELAKRLKELGMQQKSLFYWRNNVFGKKSIQEKCTWSLWFIGEDKIKFTTNDFSAFTVAELGEMLPAHISSFASDEENEEKKRIEYLCVQHHPANHSSWFHSESAETEADARAKMIVYLIENNLLTPSSQTK